MFTGKHFIAVCLSILDCVDDKHVFFVLKHCVSYGSVVCYLMVRNIVAKDTRI